MRSRLATRVTLVVFACAALGPAAFAAAPAQAEYRTYECGSCSNENGPEVYVPEAMNAIGKVRNGATGVCAAVWRWTGSSWHEYLKCTSTGTEVTAQSGFVGPFEGHGQVRRYYAMYLYSLWGEEQWI